MLQAGSSQVMPREACETKCGSWEKMAPKGNATIRRCVFMGVGMASLNKCVTKEVGFEVSFAKASPNVTVYVLLPARCRMLSQFPVRMPPCSLP